ncbi:MAG: 4Fe-4S dicluster domain-containing protein [Planctomycetota bacterium]|jgi:ferredoxin
MDVVKIEKNKIAELLTAVSSDYVLFAARVEGGIAAFRRINSATEIAADCRNPAISAKELFLPRAEVVYEFDGEKFIDDKLDSEKRVIFGMRPCDCRALMLLDKTFDTDQIKDPFYVTRRQNTVVVAVACNRPLSNCFCTAVGGDPFDEEGADVLLGDIGEASLAKAITPKGEEFLGQYGKFFSAGGSGSWDNQAKQARATIKCEWQAENVKRRLDERFESDVWETVSEKCLGCGACSYLCPTCYCFDLVDEKGADTIKKMRTWDCCMFRLFTLHASGHNPRPVNAPRLRQKIMHKFNYYPERHGVTGCVGCGRCVRCCPVNLDIRQLLEKVAAAPVAAPEK